MCCGRGFLMFQPIEYSDHAPSYVSLARLNAVPAPAAKGSGGGRVAAGGARRAGAKGAVPREMK